MRLTKSHALFILEQSGVPADHHEFFTLTGGQVLALLDQAKAFGYRAPKHRNGSKGRYFFEYVRRAVNAE